MIQFMLNCFKTLVFSFPNPNFGLICKVHAFLFMIDLVPFINHLALIEVSYSIVLIKKKVSFLNDLKNLKVHYLVGIL